MAISRFITAGFALFLFSGLAMSQEAKATAEPAQIAKEDPLEAIVLKKLSAIIIPVIDFEDASFEEAFDFLRTRARELEVNEIEPANRARRSS
jgi:hypothetical protein